MVSRRLSRFIAFVDRRLPDSLPKWTEGGEFPQVAAEDPRHGEARLTRQKECVSVIISTVDRGKFLGRTLQSLQHLRYPDFEVIVVEGPSSDETARVLDRWEDRIKRVFCPVRNLSVSRNMGIRAAKGTFVAFIDDDAVPEPDWLDRLVAPFADPAVAATGGPIRDASGVRFQCRALRVDAEGAAYKTTAEAIEARKVCPALTGTNFCMRRDLAVTAGMFDENFAYFLEETDLQQRLFDAGFRLAYVKNAEVHHLFAPSAIRVDRYIPKSFFTLSSSRAYYILKHCGGDEREHLCLRIARHLKRLDKKARRLVASRHIDEAAAAALMRSAFRGANDGIKKAMQGQACGSLAISEKTGSFPFRPFTASSAGRLRLALVCLARADASTIEAMQALAATIAARDHEVTLLVPGARASVEYCDGYWVHKIVRRWPGRGQSRLSIRASSKELRRVEVNRNFEFINIFSCSEKAGAFTLNIYENSPAASDLPARRQPRGSALHTLDGLAIERLAESANMILRSCVSF